MRSRALIRSLCIVLIYRQQKRAQTEEGFMPVAVLSISARAEACQSIGAGASVGPPTGSGLVLLKPHSCVQAELLWVSAEADLCGARHSEPPATHHRHHRSTAGALLA